MIHNDARRYNKFELIMQTDCAGFKANKYRKIKLTIIMSSFIANLKFLIRRR